MVAPPTFTPPHPPPGPVLLAGGRHSSWPPGRPRPSTAARTTTPFSASPALPPPSKSNALISSSPARYSSISYEFLFDVSFWVCVVICYELWWFPIWYENLRIKICELIWILIVCFSLAFRYFVIVANYITVSVIIFVVLVDWMYKIEMEMDWISPQFGTPLLSSLPSSPQNNKTIQVVCSILNIAVSS